jgi:carbonic anhydrase
MPTTLGPSAAWAKLRAGNERFVNGTMAHPSQDADHRARLREAQRPFAVVFGCSDSRVAAEIVFDRGLGDLFVVRTAGHVVDTTVVGSVEFGVSELGAPLVVVLGHDSCGAVNAAAQALTTGRLPEGFVRAIVDRVIPSIVALPEVGATTEPTWPTSTTPAGRVPTADDLGREHVRHTVRMLLSYSAAVRNAVEEGRCAVVGATYELTEGRVRPIEVAGPIEL